MRHDAPMTAPSEKARPRATGGAGQTLAVAHQKRVWSKRAVTWDHMNVPGLDKVIGVILQEVRGALADAGRDGPESRSGTVAVDLGCGSGQLSFPLAELVGKVVAVDVSPVMIELLEANATREGRSGVEGRAVPIEQLDVAPGSLDAVVSNYALHHLRDADKAQAVARAATWLRPGGVMAIGDMMFGRGGDARDRQIIAAKVVALARRGPGGWWRVAKNAWRYLARVQERPVSMAAWERMFAQAGLVDIRSHPVVAEAAVVSGRRPL